MGRGENTDHGYAEVSIDGGPPTSVDTYAPQQEEQQILFEKDGLSDGRHTITITVGSQKDGALVIIAQKAQTRTDQANEEAGAKHREELAQNQADLLRRNTDLTEEIHSISEQLKALTEQVHAATCGRSPASS